MSKKQSKSHSKSQSRSQSSQAQDMFNNLLETQMFSPTGSSSNPQPGTGFSPFVPLVNPFSLSPDDPRAQMHMNMYNQAQQQRQFGYVPSYPHFGQYPQTPLHQTQFQSVQTPPPEDIGDFQPEPQPDSEPELQPAKDTKKKCKKVAWSAEESRILAERWIDASENGAIGNSQTSDSFWATVRKAYNARVETKRGTDQITGKWSKMRKDVKFFIGIYKKLEEHWQSGQGDLDIMLNARKMFKQQQGRNFNYEEAWRVLKDCPKFNDPEGVMSNKRRNPTLVQELFQDEPINLEDDTPINPNPIPSPTQFEHLFREDPLRRPVGRSKSRKSSGSSDAASSRTSVEEARQKLVDSAIAQQTTMEKLAAESEKRTQLANTRTMFKAFKFLSKPVSSDLPPDERRMMMKAREKIKRRYANELRDDSEDED